MTSFVSKQNYHVLIVLVDSTISTGWDGLIPHPPPIRLSPKTKKMFIYFLSIYRRKKAWFRLLRMLSLYQDLERHSWAPYGTPLCVWGPSIPPQSKLANRVQGCMTHSCSREVQSIHVRCAGNCRVVFWRNNHILGIHRFQEESQNWHEYSQKAIFSCYSIKKMLLFVVMVARCPSTLT